MLVYATMTATVHSWRIFYFYILSSQRRASFWLFCTLVLKGPLSCASR